MCCDLRVYLKTRPFSLLSYEKSLFTKTIRYELSNSQLHESRFTTAIYPVLFVSGRSYSRQYLPVRCPQCCLDYICSIIIYLRSLWRVTVEIEVIEQLKRVYVRGIRAKGRRAIIVRFPRSTWNAFLIEEQATNSAVEGWHNTFHR